MTEKEIYGALTSLAQAHEIDKILSFIGDLKYYIWWVFPIQFPTQTCMYSDLILVNSPLDKTEFTMRNLKKMKKMKHFIY